jgi:hypothetical protein
VNRERFEHVIRATADILRDEIVVIGSQRPGARTIGRSPRAPFAAASSTSAKLRRRARLMPEATRAATTAALEGVIKRAAS